MYDYKNGKKNVMDILTSKTKIERKEGVPNEQEFTYANGIRAWVSAIFVDIIDSTEIFKSGDDEKNARLMRAFTSEIIAIMQGKDTYRQIGIRGDCVYGIYSTPRKLDIHAVFGMACEINTFMNMFNILLSKNGYGQIRVGIGLGCAYDLVIKAGRVGTGINDFIWIGDAVVDASNLADKANRYSADNIVMSELFYKNIIEYYEKNETWFSFNTDPRTRTKYYYCELVQSDFNEWINNGMK
jgi:class 3 adenylate cyclase